MANWYYCIKVSLMYLYILGAAGLVSGYKSLYKPINNNNNKYVYTTTYFLTAFVAAL